MRDRWRLFPRFPSFLSSRNLVCSNYDCSFSNNYLNILEIVFLLYREISPFSSSIVSSSSSSPFSLVLFLSFSLSRRPFSPFFFITHSRTREKHRPSSSAVHSLLRRSPIPSNSASYRTVLRSVLHFICIPPIRALRALLRPVVLLPALASTYDSEDKSVVVVVGQSFSSFTLFHHSLSLSQPIVRHHLDTIRRPFFPFIFSNLLHSHLPTPSSKENDNKYVDIIHHSPNSRASQTSYADTHWWSRFELARPLRCTIYTHCKTLILVALSSLTSSTTHAHTIDDDDDDASTPPHTHSYSIK